MKLDYKMYLIPFVFLVMVVTVILLLPKKTTNPSSPNSPQPTSIPLPTRIEYEKPNSSSSSTSKQGTSSSIVPVSILPTFTGANINQQISQQEKDATAQQRELRKKCPLQFSNFSIRFDFEADKFIVVLNQPKDTANKEFTQWLNQTYPNIPIDRFVIQP